eukprot:g1491.t1
MTGVSDDHPVSNVVDGDRSSFHAGDWDIGLGCSCWDDSKIGSQQVDLDLGTLTQVARIVIVQGGDTDPWSVGNLRIECGDMSMAFDPAVMQFEISRAGGTLNALPRHLRCLPLRNADCLVCTAPSAMAEEPKELVSCGKCATVNSVPFGLDVFKCYSCGISVVISRESASACAAASPTALYIDGLQGNPDSSTSKSKKSEEGAPATGSSSSRSSMGFFEKLQRQVDKTLQKVEQSLFDGVPASSSSSSATGKLEKLPVGQPPTGAVQAKKTEGPPAKTEGPPGSPGKGQSGYPESSSAALKAAEERADRLEQLLEAATAREATARFQWLAIEKTPRKMAHISLQVLRSSFDWDEAEELVSGLSQQLDRVQTEVQEQRKQCEALEKALAEARGSSDGGRAELLRRIAELEAWVSLPSPQDISRSLSFISTLLVSPTMAERRVDPDDGVAYTWEEFSTFYAGKYKKKAIEAYWEECEVKKGRRTKAVAKAKAEAKTKKAEPKAAPKAKAKAKAKVKAKAKAKAESKETPRGPLAEGGAADVQFCGKGGEAGKNHGALQEVKSAGNFKVCVCGGAGGIGQPLSMLMALDPNVKELCVFDLSVAMVPPAGVAADLGHLERKSDVKGYVMEVGQKPIDNLKECLTGCDLVLVPAGMPRKPGMTRDDLFKVNADIAKGIVEACAKFCPEAVLGLIVNPVNSIVPAMAELYKKKGLDPLKIVGITTLDVVRANKFSGEITGKNPNYINVPVIGGHAGTTILPLRRPSWWLVPLALLTLLVCEKLQSAFCGPALTSEQLQVARRAEKGLAKSSSGIQAEKKYDGILDELEERNLRMLEAAVIQEQDEGEEGEEEEDSWKGIKETFGWVLVADVFIIIGLSIWLIVGFALAQLFNIDQVAKTIDAEKIPDLDKHVQDAGTDVVNAKSGKGSARLGKSILAGLMGKKRIECAYVKSDITDLPYFASKVQFGEKGVTKVLPLGELSDYEKKRLEEVKTQLKTEIDSGLKYAEENSLAD